MIERPLRGQSSKARLRRAHCDRRRGGRLAAVRAEIIVAREGTPGPRVLDRLQADGLIEFDREVMASQRHGSAGSPHNRQASP